MITGTRIGKGNLPPGSTSGTSRVMAPLGIPVPFR